MRVNRKKIYIGKTGRNDEGFAEISSAERISFMWDLTLELWSLKGTKYAEQRLQRNITNLIKQ